MKYLSRRFSRAFALAIVLPLLALGGCATNPVTGKRELTLVGDSKAIAIGEQQYAPSRQMQGGDYTIDPGLTEYVSRVGNRLADSATRLAVAEGAELPYEFTVLNNSVPNAWALPGGKIAINRGLLYELETEAELAAVLGHEIVHAAARHGAQSMQRGMLTQGAMIALQLSQRDSEYANLVVGAAGLGAQLIMQKYGRDAERESDYYGTRYMAAADYNPNAAVTLQETFLRLSQESGRASAGWLEGLFASHPPSQERVENNRRTIAELGLTGQDFGRQRYQEATAYIRKTKPAYDNAEEAVEAYRENDIGRARALMQDAIAIEPREGRFYAALGDLALKDNNVQQAVGYYDQALQLEPGYFQFYVQSGMANEKLGNLQRAEADLKKSIELLPTAVAYYSLGNIANRQGRTAEAIDAYKVAAGSQSDVGTQAGIQLARLELPTNPGAYVKVQKGTDNQGNVMFQVGNASGIAIGNVTIVHAVFDAAGNQVTQTQRQTIRGPIPAGQAVQLRSGYPPITDRAQLNLVRVEVQSAQAAE